MFSATRFGPPHALSGMTARRSTIYITLGVPGDMNSMKDMIQRCLSLGFTRPAFSPICSPCSRHMAGQVKSPGRLNCRNPLILHAILCKIVCILLGLFGAQWIYKSQAAASMTNICDLRRQSQSNGDIRTGLSAFLHHLKETALMIGITEPANLPTRHVAKRR